MEEREGREMGVNKVDLVPLIVVLEFCFGVSICQFMDMFLNGTITSLTVILLIPLLIITWVTFYLLASRWSEKKCVNGEQMKK